MRNRDDLSSHNEQEVRDDRSEDLGDGHRRWNRVPLFGLGGFHVDVDQLGLLWWRKRVQPANPETFLELQRHSRRSRECSGFDARGRLDFRAVGNRRRPYVVNPRAFAHDRACDSSFRESRRRLHQLRNIARPRVLDVDHRRGSALVS